jgi:hypothetical protein
MKPSDFDEGNDISQPYVSGYDILLDKIMDDMDQNPKDYKPWEISFLGDVPQNSYERYWDDVRAFIDDWCEQHSHATFL